VNIKKIIFGILGLILLLPIPLSVPDYIHRIVIIFDFHDSKNITGSISAYIVNQVQILLVLIPGITFCSLTVLKFKFNPKWHTTLLKIYSVAAVIMLPFLSFLGIYLYILSNKNKRAAIKETT
jgi:hypothetical protein